MSLANLHLAIDPKAPIPQRVQAFLSDAAARIDRFIEESKDNPPAGFVPSDYEMVYRALATLQNSTACSAMLPGNAFCEWGSGLGVIASLASLVGFDSVGIEIDSRLVHASRELARDHRIAVELVHGSYVPNGHVPEEDWDETHVMTLENGRAAYDELGLDPDDFDCIFAYPWPGEDDIVTSIFDQYSARGAVLLTFHGQDGLLMRRKVK